MEADNRDDELRQLLLCQGSYRYEMKPFSSEFLWLYLLLISETSFDHNV